MERGRPTTYSDEVVAMVCEGLADGKSLRSICRQDGTPAMSSIFKWLTIYPDFAEQYAKAKQAGIEAFAEDILEIADDSKNDWMEANDPDNPGYRLNGDAIARSRLRVDTRKWLMSKLVPKKYGEKLQVGGADDLPAIKQEIDAGPLALELLAKVRG